MPRPRPSLVAREDVLVSEEEASDVAPSGKIGMTVGTEGVMLDVDEDESDECVREDAMIDIVVVIGVSMDDMLEVELGPDSEVGIHSEGFPVLLAVVSNWGSLHVDGVTGVVTGTDTTGELVLTQELYPGDISDGPASVEMIPWETVFEG